MGWHVVCNQCRVDGTISRLVTQAGDRSAIHLEHLSGHPQHGEPIGSWVGMISTTTVLVAAALRLGWKGVWARESILISHTIKEM